MRRTVQDIRWLAAVIGAAGGLAWTAASAPAVFPHVAAAITLGGYLLTTLVGLFALGGNVRRALGVVPLLGGLTLLAASVSVGFLPRAGSGAVVPAISLVLQATGSLGIALGFASWLSGMKAREARAEQQARSFRDEVSDLSERVRDQAHRLHQAESVDEVSGVLNRRAFLRRLDEVARRAGRVRRPFVFMLVEVTNLRAVEAVAGPRDAERALREVGDALQDATRATDFVGRLEDAAFGLALGECDGVAPVVRRLFASLAPGLAAQSRPEPVRVRVASVAVRELDRVPAFTELLRRAREVLASLDASGVQPWVATSLGPDGSPAAGDRDDPRVLRAPYWM